MKVGIDHNAQGSLSDDLPNYPTHYSVIDRRLHQMHFSIVLIASIFEYYVNETLFLTAYLSTSMLSVLIFGPRLDLVMQLIIRNRRVIANVVVLNDSYID